MTNLERQPTVLITGAAGYFGSIASDYFQRRFWNVIRASRANDSDIHINLEDPVGISKLRFNQKIDLVIHAAASHEVTCRVDPYGSITRNVSATKALLECCVRNEIKKFIYISTFHVFGNPSGIINEKVCPKPSDVYGMSHLQAEEYAEMYSRLGMIDAISIRAANLFGRPSPNSEFNRWTLTPFAFCREAIQNRKIILRTPGYQKRNFIGAEDLCRIIEWASKDLTRFPCLHAPGSETIAIRDLALRVKNIALSDLGIEVELLYPDGPSELPDFTFESNFMTDFPLQCESMNVFLSDYMKEMYEGIL